MDIHQLSGVVMVARHRNFTRAAEALMVSQPALSAQVKNLELELGVRLFERTTRHVSLTPAGAALVPYAERILAEVDAATRQMAEFSGLVRGRVRIGAWYTINPELPRLLAGFVEAHPQFEITLREENSDVMLQMLRDGELDIALPIMREGLDLTGIDLLVHRREPFALIVPRGSPLARRRQVAIKDLDGTPLIVFKPGSAVRYVVEHAFELAGVRPRITVEATETSAARAFVADGLGVALVPISVTKQPGAPVAVVSLADPPTRVSALAWRAHGRSPATEAFVSYARAFLTEHNALG